MIHDDLKHLLTRRPFHAFRITTTAGETFEIAEPRRVAVGPSLVAIGIEEEGIFRRIRYHEVAEVKELASA